MIPATGTPAAVMAAIVIPATVTLAAGLGPALRATRVDPTGSLSAP